MVQFKDISIYLLPPVKDAIQESSFW